MKPGESQRAPRGEERIDILCEAAAASKDVSSGYLTSETLSGGAGNTDGWKEGRSVPGLADVQVYLQHRRRAIGTTYLTAFSDTTAVTP